MYLTTLFRGAEPEKYKNLRKVLDRSVSKLMMMIRPVLVCLARVLIRISLFASAAHRPN